MKKILFLSLFLLFPIINQSNAESWKLISNTLLKLSENESIKSVCKDSSGGVWLCTDQSNIVYLKDSVSFLFPNYDPKNKLSTIHEVKISSDNKIYIYNNKEILLINDTLWTYLSLPGYDKYYNYSKLNINAIETHEGNLWVTSNAGLFLYHNNDWTYYDSTNSFYTNKNISDITKDKYNSIYIPNRRGMIKINDLNISRIDFNNTNDSILLYKTWINVYEGKIIDTTLNMLDGLYGSKIDFNNNIWILSRANGLFKYDGNNWTRYDKSNSNIPSYNLVMLQIDIFNNLWMAYEDGVVRFDGTNWTTFNSQNSPLNHIGPVCIYPDNDGNIWMGTRIGGLLIYYPNGFNTTSVKEQAKSDLPIIYPNPVNKELNISFDIKSNSALLIEVFDIKGIKLSTIENSVKPIGNYNLHYNAENLQNGSYILKITNGNMNQSFKFVVNR